MQSKKNSPASIEPKLIWIMAAACGITVANLYYNQPLLGDLARYFNVSTKNIGFVSTLTQIGYGIGMLFIIPLGDIKERRGLITKLLLCSSFALIFFSLSMNLTWLLIASFLVGFTSIIPQLILPFAAQLSAPNERGKVIGNVLSGLLVGILLARTISGFVGSILGWREMYYIASGLMLILSLLLIKFLPKSNPESKESYKNIMFSLIDLIKKEPLLREASLSGAMMFGAFSIFWTTLIFFLESSTYNMGSPAAGLFALLGITGVIAAPLVGGLNDSKSPKFAVGISIAIAFTGFLFLLLLGHKLIGIIFGLILLDLGTQSGQVSNQTRVHSLSPEARNRLNTVFMVSYFAGGSVGSFFGSYSWNRWGWTGVCIAGLLLLSIAAANHIVTTKKHK